MHRLTILTTALFLSMSPAAPTLAAEIAPREAMMHVGERSTVVGTVAQVSRSRGGTTFINFGGRYPNHIFYAVILKKYADRFPDISSIQGRQVAISGEVQLYKGKPQIILFSTSQLEAR